MIQKGEKHGRVLGEERLWGAVGTMLSQRSRFLSSFRLGCTLPDACLQIAIQSTPVYSPTVGLQWALEFPGLHTHLKVKEQSKEMSDF